eukprot:970772-Rhodomonas_salina.3
MVRVMGCVTCLWGVQEWKRINRIPRDIPNNSIIAERGHGRADVSLKRGRGGRQQQDEPASDPAAAHGNAGTAVPLHPLPRSQEPGLHPAWTPTQTLHVCDMRDERVERDPPAARAGRAARRGTRSGRNTGPGEC